MQKSSVKNMIKLYSYILMSCTLTCNSLHPLPAYNAKEQCPFGLATYEDVLNENANISIFDDGQSGWIAGYAQLSEKMLSFDSCLHSIRSRNESVITRAESYIVSHCARKCRNHDYFGVQGRTCYCLRAEERNTIHKSNYQNNYECINHCGGVLASICSRYARVYRLTPSLPITGYGQCVYISGSINNQLKYGSTSCHKHKNNKGLAHGYICQNVKCQNAQYNRYPICIKRSRQLPWTAAMGQCAQNGTYGSLFSISSQKQQQQYHILEDKKVGIADNERYWIGDFRAINPTDEVLNSCLAVTKVGSEIFLDSDDCRNSKVPICKLRRITSPKNNVTPGQTITSLDITTKKPEITSVIAKPCNSSFNQAGVTMFCNNTDDINNTIAKPPATDSENEDGHYDIIIGVVVGVITIIAFVAVLLFVIRMCLKKRAAAKSNRTTGVNDGDTINTGSSYEMRVNDINPLPNHSAKSDEKGGANCDYYSNPRNSNQSYQSIELSAYSEAGAGVRTRIRSTNEVEGEYDHINLKNPDKKLEKRTKFESEPDVNIYNHVTKREGDYDVTITTFPTRDIAEKSSATLQNDVTTACSSCSYDIFERNRGNDDAQNMNHCYEDQNPYDSVSTNQTHNNFKLDENIYGRPAKQATKGMTTSMNRNLEGLDVIDNDTNSEIDNEEENHYHVIDDN